MPCLPCCTFGLSERHRLACPCRPPSSASPRHHRPALPITSSTSFGPCASSLPVLVRSSASVLSRPSCPGLALPVLLLLVRLVDIMPSCPLRLALPCLQRPSSLLLALPWPCLACLALPCLLAALSTCPSPSCLPHRRAPCLACLQTSPCPSSSCLPSSSSFSLAHHFTSYILHPLHHLVNLACPACLALPRLARQRLALPCLHASSSSSLHQPSSSSSASGLALSSSCHLTVGPSSPLARRLRAFIVRTPCLPCLQALPSSPALGPSSSSPSGLPGLRRRRTCLALAFTPLFQPSSCPAFIDALALSCPPSSSCLPCMHSSALPSSCRRHHVGLAFVVARLLASLLRPVGSWPCPTSFQALALPILQSLPVPCIIVVDALSSSLTLSLSSCLALASALSCPSAFRLAHQPCLARPSALPLPLALPLPCPSASPAFFTVPVQSACSLHRRFIVVWPSFRR